MKKIKFTLFSMLMAIMVVNINAQEAEAPDVDFLYKSLEKKLVKSDAEIQNEKKMTNASTWVKRGDIMLDIYLVDQERLLGPKLSEESVKSYYKNVLEEKQGEYLDKSVKVLVYERSEIYLDEESRVAGWDVKKMVTEDPLFKAFDAYHKVIELDESGKLTEKIADNIKRLKSYLEFEADKNFRMREFKKSMLCFDYAAKTYALIPGQKEMVDTTNAFNAGLAASNAKDYENALKYFELTRKSNYSDSRLYLLMKITYVQLNDSSKILPLLKEGFEKHPKDKEIVKEMINYFINTKQTEQALAYLKIGKEQDPTNSLFYLTEGRLYGAMGNDDESIKLYQKAIELDPNIYDPYYNIAAIYYNNMVEIVEEADKIPNNKIKEYEAKMSESDEELKKSLPYIERAFQIIEKDSKEDPSMDNLQLLKSTLNTMKQIYFRIRDLDDKYQTRLNEVEEMLKKL